MILWKSLDGASEFFIEQIILKKVSLLNTFLTIYSTRHWLFGEKDLEDPDKDGEIVKKRRVRGWFPRKCAVELYEEYDEEEEDNLEPGPDEDAELIDNSAITNHEKAE